MKTRSFDWVGWLLLLGGPALFLAILFAPAPGEMAVEAQRTAAVAAWTAWWWLTGILPLGATALLPFVLFPFLGVMDGAAAISHFAHWLNFLFLGGFLIAAAIEKWNLHKRIALAIIARVGVTPRRIVLGFMIATAFISMWVTNTATTLMMLPVAAALLVKLRDVIETKHFERLAPALMLAIAYSSSIGGLGTLIGTGPTGVFVSQLDAMYGRQISFTRWLIVGMPFVLIMIPILWLYLVRVQYPMPVRLQGESGEAIDRERKALGPMSREEKLICLVAALTAFGWLFRKKLQLGSLTIPGIQTYIPTLSNDASVAIAGAMLLFCIPSNLAKREFILDMKTALRIPWDLLLIIGGGVCLAAGFQDSGLSTWIAHRLIFLQGASPLLIVFVTVALVTFLTELTSNTATATIFMPILGSMAVALGQNPMLLMLPANLAVSMAFMLPVATPPNAIVYGSGYVSSGQMARTGFWMNLIAITLITVLFYGLTRRVLGIELGVVPEWAHP
ncbi:MAG: DASS family sodium-coupled anion symporter [bacterium]|nr:DASS family sodium-coupled anion symporter [bacterium]